jgi:hypothetical protein
MSTAEVMTVTLVAAAVFDGSQEKSRRFLKEHGYIKTMLSKSRFNRRWHAIPEVLWQGCCGCSEKAAKLIRGIYAVDSVPIPVCDNIRIRRCRLYPCKNKASKTSPKTRPKTSPKTRTEAIAPVNAVITTASKGICW